VVSLSNFTKPLRASRSGRSLAQRTLRRRSARQSRATLAHRSAGHTRGPALGAVPGAKGALGPAERAPSRILPGLFERSDGRAQAPESLVVIRGPRGGALGARGVVSESHGHFAEGGFVTLDGESDLLESRGRALGTPPATLNSQPSERRPSGRALGRAGALAHGERRTAGRPDGEPETPACPARGNGSQLLWCWWSGLKGAYTRGRPEARQVSVARRSPLDGSTSIPRAPSRVKRPTAPTTSATSDFHPSV